MYVCIFVYMCIYVCIYTYMYVYIKKFIIGIVSCNYGGWEVPWSAVCRLETQENSRCNSNTSLKARESGELMVYVPVQAQEERQMTQLENGQAKRINSLFCSIQASSGLAEALPHWGRWPALLSLPNQVLISSRILTDTLRTMFSQISGHPVAQLTHKINYHIYLPSLKYKPQEGGDSVSFSVVSPAPRTASGSAPDSCSVNICWVNERNEPISHWEDEELEAQDGAWSVGLWLAKVGLNPRGLYQSSMAA